MSYAIDISNELQRDAAPEVDILRQAVCVARIPHNCDVCRSPIPAGTQHTATLLRVDGELQTHRECHAHSWMAA